LLPQEVADIVERAFGGAQGSDVGWKDGVACIEVDIDSLTSTH
jgi:hypothetical protein